MSETKKGQAGKKPTGGKEVQVLSEEQKQCIRILVSAAEVGNKAGSFSLDEALNIATAKNILSKLMK